MKNKPYPLYQHAVFHTQKEMIYRQALTEPEQPAFAWTGKEKEIVRKTYREFREDMDALGTYLLTHGYQSRKIAILGENSYEWVLCFMAAVNSGNIAVAVDKELSAEKAGERIEFADCAGVVYSGQYADKVERLKEGIARIPMENFPLYLAEGRSKIEQGNKVFLDYEIDTEAPAAIFFTSGTTGDSRGVVLSQRNICSDLLGACQNVLLCGPTLSVLPYHHSFGLVAGVLALLYYGFPVFINRSLKRLLQDMALARPQNLFLVPLFVETFHRQIWEKAEKSGKGQALRILMKFSDILLCFGVDLRKKLFSPIHQTFGGKLECIVSGGAALDKKYVKEFRSWGFDLLNGYGITECSPVVSVNRNCYKRDGSIGQVLDCCQVKISENNEILVKGNNVMLGYYKNEEETAAALQDGWYATGDLGYLDKDGFLFLTGRKKNLIILSSGENISPEELEQEILKDDAAAEVIVYEKDGKITAQIYPQEAFSGNQEYFEKLIRKINRDMLPYKRINRVVLRDKEFEKSTTKKILRHKAIRQ